MWQFYLGGITHNATIQKKSNTTTAQSCSLLGILEQQEAHAVTLVEANCIMSHDAVQCIQCQTWHSMPILAFDANYSI